MRSRRPSRDRRHRAMVHAIQSIRLEGLLTGAYTPRCDREAMYLDLCRSGARVEIEDFILSPALLLLERMIPELEDETFTADPEPAIPRP